MARGLKTGGRQKGTPNKTTKEIRELLSGILITEIGRIPQYLSEIEPEKKLQTITKLLPFVVPTCTEVPISETEINGIDFIMQLNENIKAKHA